MTIHSANRKGGNNLSELRAMVSALARLAHAGVFSAEEAARALSLSPRNTTLRLTSLVRRGWLKRLRRGLYLVLPLETESGGSAVVEDPWILARELFSPCYIGGWSAAEHWGLTEQLFRSTFVVSATQVRRTEQRIESMEFHIVRARVEWVKRTGQVWRGHERVATSSREQSITDALIAPAWIGGIRHLAEILRTYRESEHWNPQRLLSELDYGGSGAAYKRLGYLVEAMHLHAPTVIQDALARRTLGVSKLDPTIRSQGSLLKRWGLWINADLPSNGDRA